jgi:hypothetical protein
MIEGGEICGHHVYNQQILTKKDKNGTTVIIGVVQGVISDCLNPGKGKNKPGSKKYLICIYHISENSDQTMEINTKTIAK